MDYTLKSVTGAHIKVLSVETVGMDTYKPKRRFCCRSTSYSESFPAPHNWGSKINKKNSPHTASKAIPTVNKNCSARNPQLSRSIPCQEECFLALNPDGQCRFSANDSRP